MAKRWHRTIDTHLWDHTPHHQKYDQGEKFYWQAGKVGYEDSNVLFTTLHDEYNSFKCALSDAEAWHFDVAAVARTANDNDEFLALLKERQEQRIDEIQKGWRKTKLRLMSDPACFDMPPPRAVLFKNFGRVSRNFSYDSLVTFFGSYGTGDKSSAQPQLSSDFVAVPSQPPQPERQPEGNMAASSSGPKSSSRAPKSKPRDTSGRDGVRRSARLRERAEKARQ
ncbi:hypothetical protein N7530_010250 [Penicillium desertorum]|uniref:Uncharacterized protein n=1 Tax=Penicillium desertorum TaxID=1303715 RepID=A0A9W9WK14_9EURO|nr:hypothetical protein N7530_010250 [Penicillium desertorum]